MTNVVPAKPTGPREARAVAQSRDPYAVSPASDGRK